MEEEKKHPLECLGIKHITFAYYFVKVSFVILGIATFAGGIVLCCLSGVASTTDLVVGLLIGGLMMTLFGPVVVIISWLITRLWFKLMYDTHIIKSNICPNDNKEQKETDSTNS